MGRLLDEDILVKIIDRHTNDQNELDDDITCILEEVPIASMRSVLEQIETYLYKEKELECPEDGYVDCEDFETCEDCRSQYLREIIKGGGIR